VQARGGEHDRVERLSPLQALEASIDVAVQLDHLEVGAACEDLSPPAQAGGADGRVLGYAVERAALAEPRILSRFASRDAGDHQPLGQGSRQVLRRVDADVRAPLEQLALDRAHEARLVARLTVRGSLDQLRVVEQRGDGARLGQCQLAAPGREAQRHRAT